MQKYLARAGVASRRHAEELITEGRVTVNNQKVTELGSKVSPGDLVTVDGKLVSPPEESTYYLLYKPVGVVTTLSDPQGRPTVANYIEETGKRLFPVGRLDYDAEGALLVTDDGALAHKLTHPSFQVPRTYLAKVKGAPDAATLDKLRSGVRLEDGMATPLSVDVFEQAERNTWLKIVVAEGRPHLIKRLCAAVGAPVVRLYRPSYAGITVEGLRPGEMKPLSENQVRMLQEVADGKATPPERELKLPPRRHGRSAPGFETADVDDDDFDDEAPPAPARSRAAAKKPAPRGAARTERPERKGVKAERPARAAAGAPERKAFGPRGEGGSRPAFRGAAGRTERRGTWTPGEDEAESGVEETPSSRPEREERSERPARKPFGASAGGRPERKPFGASAGGRPERREWSPRGGAERGERSERPARKPFGAGPRGGEERGERPARKPFGAAAGGRPERREWSPRGGEERGARPARKSFGADAGGRPERREWSPRGGEERGERPARKPFGAGARGGEERSERPARKPFGAGAGGRPERREWSPRGGEERSERPARKPFGAGPRGGEERSERPARKPFGAGAGGRPERREWSPRGGEERGERGARPARASFGSDPSAERRVPARGPRPERREWAPRGEERGSFASNPSAERRVPSRGPRPERREWAPRGEERGERPARKPFGAGEGGPARRGAARPGGEESGEGSKPFVNWRAKKTGPTPEWNTRAPRGAGGPRGGGAGAPRGRGGPRKGR
ncbi:Ribosomal large subunit pseudouridine synthase B [Archangium gephyra]|uniref:Pseudouridine synthase n=1 Tax=Archangium gephyra TaxID=48 RepID=A0AAC8TFF4_9BACT|nr:Ribosomal large subunit pseudouridine synthase B [Archangium gephyra]